MKKEKITIMFLIMFILLQTQCSMLFQPNDAADVTDSNIEPIGWTEFIPSNDTRLIYVSNGGNDETGTYYSKYDTEIGIDPFNPDGTILPFATYAAARENVRNGYPDWILFEQGGTFELTSENAWSGRSTTERALVSSYGSSGVMPILTAGISDDSAAPIVYATMIDGLYQNGASLEHWALKGLDFYKPTADPANYSSANDIPNTTGGGAWAFYGKKISSVGWVDDIFVEGCRFRYLPGSFGAMAYDDGSVSNITLNRCQVLNSYVWSADYGHAQGCYFQGIKGLYIYECLFDHNGWLQQNDGTETTVGQATVFNHNMYITACSDVYISNNISLRPSSIHVKLAVSEGQDDSVNVHVENNLMVDGEFMVSAGGNSYYANRFRDIHINNNMGIDLDYSSSTNRDITWGIIISDWNDGEVSNNYLINFDGYNCLGLELSYTNYNVLLKNNLLYNIRWQSFHVINDYDNYRSNINIVGNDTYDSESYTIRPWVYSDSGLNFVQNNYYSTTSYDYWYGDKNYLTFEDWRTNVEYSATSDANPYPDPTRNPARYNSEICGGDESLEGFYENVREHTTQNNWDDSYMAGNILKWLKAGFNE